VSAHVKSFLWRGLGAGAAGGLATALFLRFVTETQIGYALRFEDAAGLGLPAGEAAEFSRGTQQWGGMLAAVLYGAVMGLVFGVAVAALHHRVAGRTEFERGAKIAIGAFVAVALLPALKYPPNPPTVGDPDTITDRTTSFLLFTAAAIVVVFALWALWERLTEHGWPGARRFALAGAVAAVVATLLFVVWPASPDRIGAPDNEAAPALRVAEGAPDEVLAALLDSARTTNDVSLRDPDRPDQPLDLDSISDPRQLVGVPYAVSTSELVPNAYTTVVWHFRLQTLAGLALMWLVMATAFGLLCELPARAHRSVNVASTVDPLDRLGGTS
jgi:hypothetical protein